MTDKVYCKDCKYRIKGIGQCKETPLAVMRDMFQFCEFANPDNNCRRFKSTLWYSFKQWIKQLFTWRKK